MAGPSPCGSKLAKFILFCFNILFWLIGFVILAIGIWALVNAEGVTLMNVASVEVTNRLVQAAAVTFIVVGFIVFVTAFLGCCGSVKENSSMLLAYVVVLGCILVLQFISGILVAVYRDEILSNLSKSMNKTVTERYDGESGLSKAYDYLQYKFECCGAFGPKDWFGSQWQLDIMASNETIEGLNVDQTVPLTCCPLTSYIDGVAVASAPDRCMTAATQIPALRPDDINPEGCYVKLEEWIGNIAAILLGIAFGFVAIEVFGIILACYLRMQLKKGYENV